MSFYVVSRSVWLPLMLLATAAVAPSALMDSPFLGESHQAMERMMADMAVQPSGNADQDFARMMIPHHQGAIDMAVAELKFGRDPRLRRIAQEIVVDQQQEIVAMRDALNTRKAPTPVPNDRPANHPMVMPMNPSLTATATFVACLACSAAIAGPNDIPISHRDRLYAAEQFSNTVSVIDPADDRLLGVIRLGDPQPANFSPLYKGQVLVHGMGFSPDHRMLAVVAIGSNAVSFIDTATNKVVHVTYVGRSPHEAFYTPDGREVWVTVRGENYIAVLDAATFAEKTRITVPNGPGMSIFSPDGRYGYVCSSFEPETVVIDAHAHRIVGHVPQASSFCPNIAVTPDGKQVWFTLKDIGKVQVFDAAPPFRLLRTIDTGPITNHVNFARTGQGQLAYVTVGGSNAVKVFRTDDASLVATIPVGAMPHGVWPSGDGRRIYVGLENGDAMTAIDTATNRVVATIPIGQAPQAIAYVPQAVRDESGSANLAPLGLAGQAMHLSLAPAGAAGAAPTSVTLFDQGLLQVLQAAVTGLEPKRAYLLALADRPDGGGASEPIARFMTNPAGAAIVDTAGPIRQVVDAATPDRPRRYLVILPADQGGAVPVQVQRP